MYNIYVFIDLLIYKRINTMGYTYHPGPLNELLQLYFQPVNIIKGK